MVVAKAKINLFLAVGDRRPDGYHDVDTVMTAIDRSDLLDVSLAPEPKLEVQPEDLPPGPQVAKGEDNLVWKAATHLGEGKGWRITLYKMIPPGAGLGGGSVDAAATLRALAALWKFETDLAGIAAEVGSDVPFFLHGGICRATGRGERIEQLGPGPPLHIVVAVPEVQISTSEAYEWLDALPDRPRADAGAFVKVLASGDPQSVAASLHNDFEAAVLPRFPQVARLKDRLGELGALGTLLCGTGSGVFGIFDSPECATEVSQKLRREGIWAVYAPTSPIAVELGGDPLAGPVG